MAIFSDLGLSEEQLTAIHELGYDEPTPIQEQAIPVVMSGRDVIAHAQTGTGKTAAFALPIIARIKPEKVPQALILTPTRELAMQVAEAFFRYGKHAEVRVAPVYGGQPIERQLRALSRGVQIIVGTPGRIMDHMRRGTLALDNISVVVLDEADEMLDMGFAEDIEYILQQTPAERQTALFSATMPSSVLDLALRYTRDPQRISVVSETLTAPRTKQVYYEVLPREKLDALCRVLDVETPGSAMIFCRTRAEADHLGESLQGRGYLAEVIHGDLSQAMRERVMKRFREGQAELLVATDVAARGLDIADVTHVINYDVPGDPESYVHRIGRTGRAGRTGLAISLITPRERRQIQTIERTTRSHIQRMKLPSLADVAARRREAFREALREVLAAGSLDPYVLMVEEMAESHEVTDLAAAAFKLLLNEAEQEDTLVSVEGDGAGTEPGMTRLFLDVGRLDRVRPADIVGAIANEIGIPGRQIGSIDIYDRFAFVEVPSEHAPRVVRGLGGVSLRGKPVRVSFAKPRG
ncbi:DEAD/DEAH box helicase [Candidatus Chloroploca sp. M-50]|uniref:RNA helicase n=1 Tax=Candidatus Chloroploca mongolica TaxID=2528176 RepID=A0ABS4D427_9CHLR|nr:DEAD/DEAH box helicase [Candidatus Chloroploca mongolica]MBP1464192.1 DEAD/DEAH box helicase [Candidatus Chloroploca mongolica]